MPSLLSGIPSKDFHNYEEKRVILGPERDAAKTLGETKITHTGTAFVMPSILGDNCEAKLYHIVFYIRWSDK